MQLSSRMSRPRGLSAIPGNKIRGIPNMLDSQQNLLQSHRLALLAPPKRSRKAFILCNSEKHQHPKSYGRSRRPLLAPRAQHTEKVLHQRPIRRPSFRVSKRDYRRRQLAQAELLHRRGERVRGVESARVDLAREFAVGELLRGEHAGGPEGLGGGEGGGVEEVVVAVVGVHAAVLEAGLVGWVER